MKKKYCIAHNQETNHELDILVGWYCLKCKIKGTGK